MLDQADHLLLHQEEPPAAIISRGSHQEDPANPAALPLSSSSSYAPAQSSSRGSPTSFELKGKELKTVRKKEEEASRKKTETGREETPHHHRQGAEIICSKERNLKVNYLLSPESGAWLEPPGPPSASSGLSRGSWTGQRCQLGLTIGKGGKELLPGGRGGRSSNSVSNSRIAYPAPAGKPDCRVTFLKVGEKFKCKDDANFSCEKLQSQPMREGESAANPEEGSPLDDARKHHHQLITSSTSDTGVISSSQSS